ncbi:unnamed protein product [Polarella glacialis]|uniref:Uncharacterized protein n=1 Tax=Polarella glacialis TaxID=89957 RepID=A0A813HTF9_POLGL|nr:unnamed protein product [Polarella glacialis]CAE8655554.1 unnamed protein product [Polarella glacialis]
MNLFALSCNVRGVAVGIRVPLASECVVVVLVVIVVIVVVTVVVVVVIVVIVDVESQCLRLQHQSVHRVPAVQSALRFPVQVSSLRISCVSRAILRQTRGGYNEVANACPIAFQH